MAFKKEFEEALSAFERSLSLRGLVPVITSITTLRAFNPQECEMLEERFAALIEKTPQSELKKLALELAVWLPDLPKGRGELERGVALILQAL